MAENINVRELYISENSELSSSITQSWTEQALECYSIGCNCKKCSLSNGSYSFKCQMPKVIDTLINIIGKPQVNTAY
jgi:hypothetical protein